MRRVLFASVMLLFAGCAAELPAMPGHPVARPRAASTLRVVTFNLYNPPWKRRARFYTQLETLRRIDADVIALQEVATGIHLEGEPASFLARALGFAGVRFWHQENLGLFRTGLGLLARYPIDQVGYRPFGDSILFDPKGYLYATVQTPMGPLTVVDVHMASTDDLRIKRVQFEGLAEGVEALRRAGPVLVLGDFNTEPDHPLLIAFKMRLDADALLAERPTWNESLDDDCTKEGGERLDHVFLVAPRQGRARLRIAGGRIIAPNVRPHPSDHCPVVAEIDFASAP